MIALLITLDGDTIGLPIHVVEEIVRAVALAPLPGAPAPVEGVVNVRGSLLPVFDLRARFGMPTRPIDPADVLVLARAGERRVALRADAAEDITTIDDAAIAPASILSPALRQVAGVAATADGAVVIEDLAALINQGEAIALDRALAAARTSALTG